MNLQAREKPRGLPARGRPRAGFFAPGSGKRVEESKGEGQGDEGVGEQGIHIHGIRSLIPSLVLDPFPAGNHASK